MIFDWHEPRPMICEGCGGTLQWKTSLEGKTSWFYCTPCRSKGTNEYPSRAILEGVAIGKSLGRAYDAGTINAMSRAITTHTTAVQIGILRYLQGRRGRYRRKKKKAA